MIEIRQAVRDQVDDHDADVLLEQGRTLCQEGTSVFGAVPVRGADQLDGSDQPTAGARVVDADGVIIPVGQVGFPEVPRWICGSAT